jgi:hypothetical protein
MTLVNDWPFDFVEVEWDDAESAQGWENFSEIQMSEALVVTRGWLVHRTRKHILLAMSISYDSQAEDHSFNNRIQIPRGMVKRMTILAAKDTPAVAPKAPDGAA